MYRDIYVETVGHEVILEHVPFLYLVSTMTGNQSVIPTFHEIFKNNFYVLVLS